MRLKRTKLSALFVPLFLLLSVGAIASPGAPTQLAYYGVDEEATLVYEISHLLFNETESEFETEGGKWAEGHLLMFEIEELQDTSLPNANITLELKPSDADSEEITYPIELAAGWPAAEDLDGPIFWRPVISLPEASEWPTIEADWDAVDGLNATYEDTLDTFTLNGTNPGLNVTYFEITWDTINGTMAYYWYNTTWGPNSEGADAWAIEFELTFKYFRDESQWGVGWGVDESDMAAWRIDTLDFNYDGQDEIPWKNWPGQNYTDIEDSLHEGDLMVFMFHELSDLTQTDPQWNGTLMTPEFSDSIEFHFGDDGDNGGNGGTTILEDEEDGDDGPPIMLWPLFPTGNDLLFGNLTDEWNAMGDFINAYFTDDLLNLTMNIPPPPPGEEGGYLYQSVEWNRTTGLMMDFVYNGSFRVWDGSEDVHVPVYLEVSFVYSLPFSEMSWGINPGFHQRYLATEIGNGTLDYLDFGDGGNGDDFRMYDDDLVGITFGALADLATEGAYVELYMQTQSGYVNDEVLMELRPPGLEMHGGPPGFYLAIPLSSSTTWWDDVAAAYTALGYTSTNNATTIGFEVTGMVIEEGTIDFRVFWSKTDGVLEYYRAAGTVGGDVVVMEIRRGINLDPAAINWNWGVNIGHQMTYEFTAIDWDNNNTVPYAENNAIGIGDDIYIKLKTLGSLTSSQPEVGILADLWANGDTQDDTPFSFAEPGFEFTEWFAMMEGENGGGPPLGMALVIPVGDAAYWNLLADLYEEAGYTVTDSGDVFGIDGSFDYVFNWEYTAQWNKTTGVMIFYESFVQTPTGQSFSLTMQLIAEGESPPTESTESTTTIPGFEALFIIPMLVTLTLLIRRRR
ncbi:MAG: hypothetical protein ACFFB3_13840 [Candidatus Hodarchaeota archaeon]